MLYELDNEGQRKQFAQVIDHLVQTGEKKKDIAMNIGLPPHDISRLISGALKNISSDTIESLHENYQINPNYIIKGATNMYDIPGIKYENFEMFVDDWDLVKHKEKEYLHFTMDEGFYNFLIDVYKLKEATQNSNPTTQTVEAFEKAAESYKEKFPNSISLKEYVLIPEDDMIEIVTDNVERKKNLAEVINLLELNARSENEKGNGAD